MSAKFIKAKKIVTMGLTALMCLGSAASFWELPESELDNIALNPLSVTVYAADLSQQFTDQIPQWASSDISYLVDKGIMKGYEDGTFRASGTMTKLEFITAVVRSLRTDAEIEAKLKEMGKGYTGADASEYRYQSAIETLNNYFKEAGMTTKAEDFWGTKYYMMYHFLNLGDGIVLGPHNTTSGGMIMGFNEPIQRDEAAAIMYHACADVRGESLPETKGIHKIIPDYSNIATDRAGYVGQLVSNGLLAGVDDNMTFAPKQTLTRAQAACILARITDTSRRLAKPVVPEEKQEWINSSAKRDITYHNPVTGKDETRDINDWERLINATGIPSHQGKDGEYSPDGYFIWAEGQWCCEVAF